MYSNDGTFKLIDFQMSHNELLFRSYANKEREYNIDILFKGTHSLNITTTYKGIVISAISKRAGQTADVLLAEKYIFRLSDKLGLETYIDASAFGIFKNNLGFGVTSLGDFMWSDNNECLYWSHEDSEFKKMFDV